MAINHINAVFRTLIPCPADKLVALALADFADRDTGKAWPAVATLERMTSLSERTIRTALQRLVAAGHLTIDRSIGRGHSSCYWLHVKGAADAPFAGAPDDDGDTKGAAVAPLETEKGAASAPIPEIKGADAAPFPDTKGANGVLKGANAAIKGAAAAPHPLRTVKEPREAPSKPAALPSLDEILIFVQELALPPSDGESCYWKWEANGWTNQGEPIRNWKATIRAWKASGYLPSQKATGAARPVAGHAPREKKIKREPERLGELLALIRASYPDATFSSWHDLPADVRAEAERQLSQQTKPQPDLK